MSQQAPITANAVTEGWYADPTGRHQRRYWNGYVWSEFVNDGGATFVSVHDISAHPLATTTERPDNGFVHLLRFFGFMGLFALGSSLLIGFVWLPFVLTRVGYRKRDTALAFIPIFGTILCVTGFWRLSALDAYWTPRSDRQSLPMQQPWLIITAVVGWLALPALVLLSVASAFLGGWNDVDRQDFITTLVLEGVDPDVARCVQSEIEDSFPTAADINIASDAEIGRAMGAAFIVCE